MQKDKEIIACVPQPLSLTHFNVNCVLPYSLTIEYIYQAMDDFIDFLGFINQQLHTKDMSRLETFLMSANFSSMVGEFMNMRIPKYCANLVKNGYHNGHPDLIPRDVFPDNAIQYTTNGIEIKSSRYKSGWQGHNPEAVWLMVFYFNSNTANDEQKGIDSKPFAFKGVYAAKVEKDNWNFSGRSATSWRTITASINRNGLQKMKANWIYENLGD